MLVLLAAVATGAMAQTTYKVSVKEGTEDATNWTITPAEATTTGVAAGTEVKATYGGTKKVKSVKAVKKAPAVTTLDNTTTAWTAGSYAVPAGGLTYSAAITVSGDVTLVLTDGTTLTLNKGISLIIMDYMDAMTATMERMSECSMQVAMKDGRVIPFCSYQMTNAAGERLYEMWGTGPTEFEHPGDELYHED